jgi:Protein of unknown function (DUF2752)
MFKKSILVFKYLLDNLFISLACLYFMVSIILKSLTKIDICMPCLWRKLFNIRCFGCGLTTAFINLLKMDFEGAIRSNWLIYIVIPAGFYFISYDFIKYKTKYYS